MNNASKHTHMPLLGLIACLERSGAIPFRLYERLKLRAAQQQPATTEELRMAAGLPPSNAEEAAILVANLKLEGLGIMLEENGSLPVGMLVRLRAHRFHLY